MKVLKFGGTSIGTVERIKSVAKLVCNDEKKIVVLSAMAGTTNSLIEIANQLFTNDNESTVKLINGLENKYSHVINKLYSDEHIKQKGNELIKYHFDYIRSFTQDLCTAH